MERPLADRSVGSKDLSTAAEAPPQQSWLSGEAGVVAFGSTSIFVLMDSIPLWFLTHEFWAWG